MLDPLFENLWYVMSFQTSLKWTKNCQNISMIYLQQSTVWVVFIHCVTTDTETWGEAKSLLKKVV